MNTTTLKRLPVSLLVALAASASFAAIDVVPPGGGGGSDGVLDPSVDDAICVGGLTGGICEIDLALAACDCSGSPPGARTVCPAEGSPDRCTWNGTNPSDDDPSGTVGNGVYDSDQWAVVYRFSSVNIQPSVYVYFKNHPSRAPVVWLVDGSVTIDGGVRVNGANENALTGTGTHAEPGPGGFRGSMPYVNVHSTHGAGLGPGGPQRPPSGWSGGGSHGTVGSALAPPGPTYGSERLVPLLGGSGGSSNTAVGYSGGAGGGALLVAADQTIAIAGDIQAYGGADQDCNGGGGAGGAIRLVADTIQGAGALRAIPTGSQCYHGGDGRIRTEAIQPITLADAAPAPTSGYPCVGLPPFPPDCPAEIWPEDLAAPPPAIRIVDIAGQNAPEDPRASFAFPTQDVRFADPDPVTITVETRDVPLTWNVKVRVTPQRGDYIETTATHQGPGSSPGWEAWTVSVAVPNKSSAVQARACDPAQGAPYCP